MHLRLSDENYQHIGKVQESIYNYQRDFKHTCSQTRSRSLQTWHLLEWDMTCWSISWRVSGSLEGRYAQRSDFRSDIKMNQCQTYETVVVTFTLFSHSNSVHMLRNWGKTIRSAQANDAMDGWVHILELRYNTQAWCNPWCQYVYHSISHKPPPSQVLPTRYYQR